MEASFAGRAMLAVLLAAWAASAQEHQSMGGANKPATLLAGLGHHHHPISTKNAEAQRFFDQGLTLVYAFNHEEAVRSFLHAAELDPQSPMPLWGVALAVGPNYNLDVNPQREKVAYKAIQAARALAAQAPESERAYVEALARRYSGDDHADLKKLAVDYKNAMRELAARYLDDLDAATLYAESMMDLHPWSLWTPDGKPTADTEEVLAVLQSVLRRDPKHIGANHFYIHAVEASPRPEVGLASARQLETLVPAAGHLVHMPSHIYLRTGHYAEAVKSNEAAAQADRAYLNASGMQGSVYGRMYYSHSLQFLAIAAGMQGNFSEAKRAADQLAANVRPAVKQMPMLEALLATPVLVLARFQRWDDILKLPAPDSSLVVSSAVWHYARGVAFTAKGQSSKAPAERRELATATGKQPAEGMLDSGMSNSASAVLPIALEVLDARISAGRGDRKAAIAHWQRAVAMQDALAYNEPPDWYYPVRESLGGELLRAAEYEEAEKVFRADLERNPRNPRSLFGLLKALEAQKKTAGAQRLRRQFEEAWKSADVPLRIEDL